MSPFVRMTLVILIALASAPGVAARVETKGVGTYQYESRAFSSKPTDQEKAKALAAAKEAAWKNYVAGLNEARKQVIAQKESEFLASLDRFIIDYVVLDTTTDPKAHLLTEVVRVAFNDDVVGEKIRDLTVGADAHDTRSAHSLFTFIFLARKATAVRQFDVRRADVVKTDTAQSVAADGAVSRMSMSESGGSNLRKEDAVTYSVASSQDLDSAMGNVLSTSGIEYASYDDIVGNCNAPPVDTFRDEYVLSDELSAKTRAAVVQAVQTCDVRYLATGTIDSDVARIDPVTGNQQVFVSVRAQLWDVSKDQRLPRKIGSVGPKQFSGLGPSQAVAARNALNTAAQATAKELIDQLNAKSIR